jgi:hypothetical protein
LETELSLDPDSNPDPELITDPDPNLQIIPDPDAQHCKEGNGAPGSIERMPDGAAGGVPLAFEG